MKLLNRPLCHAAVVVVDEGKSSGPTRITIRRDDHLHRIANRAEVLPDIRFGRAVREIADE